MKAIKYLASIILSLAILVMLFACGGDTTCTSHTDADSNGKCDTCGETVETENNNNGNTGAELALIKDGAVNFQIVRSANPGSGVMMLLNTLQMNVQSAGGTLDIVNDKADTEKSIVEVLIGDITSRGEKYEYDKYSLGAKGYIIKMIDNKIIINAGSSDKLVDAVEEFIEDILGMKSAPKTLSDITMTADKEVVKIQDDYRITSISINGSEINGYTIACDISNTAHKTAAETLNKFFYENAGYYLPIVPLAEEGKSVIIEAVDYAGEDGFLIETDNNGALRIQCAYANAFEGAFNNFFTSELRIKTGDIKFDTTYKYTEEVSVVYYENYMHLSVNGNDYPAIKAAHDFANEGGQLVKAGRGKTYTITDLTSDGENYSPIYIKTNVDFGTAKILIDDTYLTSHLDKSNEDVFIILPSASSFYLSSEEISAMFPDGIDAETLTKIDWNYNYPALLVVQNSERKVYKRYGDADYNDGTDRGSAQSELIVVDKDGNIDPETTFMFDYTKVTGVTVYPIDEEPLSITGGIFTTKASHYVHKVNGAYKVDALHRGFCSRRSNVTFNKCEYYVTNEVTAAPTDPDNKGAGYDGFFRVQVASDVTFNECILTARRYYYVRGSYALNAHTANRVVMKNCTQSNFYILDENGNPTDTLSMQNNWYWGVCGTSSCKNLIYDGSTLSRFDSHTNLQNGKIINSKITGIQLIGGGEFLIENTEIVPVSNVFVNLRQDYGATWKGTITIKNCKATNNFGTEFTLVNMPWVNHDFGYASYMPNLIVDNFKLTRDVPINVFKSTGGHYAALDFVGNGDANINKLNVASFITLKNNISKHRYVMEMLDYYKDINITTDKTIEIES